MPEQTPPNGTRITLAVLNANVLHLAQEQRETRETICAQLRDHEARLRAAENWNTQSQERWRSHEDDHRALSAKNWAADIIGSLGALIGGIFVGRP